MKCKWIRCCPECAVVLNGPVGGPTREHGTGRCVVCGQRTVNQEWGSERRSPRGKMVGR